MPTSRKRKAPLLSMPRAKRPRPTSSTTSSTPPNEALVAFPSDVVRTQTISTSQPMMRLTDIILNPDATITCDYSFKGVGKMETFQHLGSAFATDNDIRVRSGQWVNVNYETSSSSSDEAKLHAPALIVHLFGYRRREFALIAWGYCETDPEVKQLLANLEDTLVEGQHDSGIVPSDYFQIVDTESIESVVSQGLLPVKKDRPVGGEVFWRGYWMLQFSGVGRGKEGLWKPKDAAPPTETTNSTFVDAMEKVNGAVDGIQKAGTNAINSVFSMSSPGKKGGKTPSK